VRATRIGFVGAGAVARRHAATIEGLPDAEVAAVCDPDRQAVEAFARLHGAAVRPNLVAMLEDEEIDAIYVCVPPFAHGVVEEAVIARGLPLFVEKPLALDLATAERLAAEIRSAGILTATGYHWRHLDVVRHARDLLRGRPARLVHAAWLDKLPPPAWWPHRNGSGGQVIEQATHVLDPVRVLAGEVVEVCAAGARTGSCAPEDGDVDDVTAATLWLQSGGVGVVTASCLLAHKARTAVEVVSDGVMVTLTDELLTVDDGVVREERRAAATAKVDVDSAFIRAVRGEDDPAAIAAPYEEALRTHRLACAIARSAAERRPVRVDG
jgi:myo-inositol 2-dehydrogenase / D-chiro-inositol 1-dehydrogenase